VPPTTDPAVAGPLPRLCRRANLSREIPRKSHLWDLSAPLRPLARRQRSGGAFRKHRLTYVLFVGWPRF